MIYVLRFKGNMSIRTGKAVLSGKEGKQHKFMFAPNFMQFKFVSVYTGNTGTL